ncbi:MAG: YitT family protein [Bacteroidota bacterium]
MDQKVARRRKIFRLFWEYFQIALGIVLASIGLKAFLLPNGFLDGGITGVALLIISQIPVNFSLLLVLLSLPFLILAYRAVSRRVALKSIFSIVGLAFFIQFETFDVITNDKLLIAIFGGLFVGLGIGLAIRNGAVLDGSEIIGIWLHEQFGIPIGRIILGFNVILFSITALLLSVEIAMYSILTYLITARVTDLIIEGFEDYIGIMIVSPQYETIRDAILTELGAGLTLYHGEQGYGSQGNRKDFMIIHSIINRIDIRRMHRIINTIDPEAFVVEFDVNQVQGGVLRRYLDRKPDKKLAPEVLQKAPLPIV